MSDFSEPSTVDNCNTNSLEVEPISTEVDLLTNATNLSSVGTSESEPKSRRSSTNSEGNISYADKLLKTLQFRNPGPQISDFDPDKSKREMRKLRRFAQKEQASKRSNKKNAKKQPFHDEYGLRISDKRDVCDCQNLECPGCHFPCPSCGSEKCGVECRCDRLWTYDQEVDIQVLPSIHLNTARV